MIYLNLWGRPSTRGIGSRRRAVTAAMDDKSEGEIDTRYLDDMTLVIDRYALQRGSSGWGEGRLVCNCDWGEIQARGREGSNELTRVGGNKRT